jgi:hypothetical protein
MAAAKRAALTEPRRSGNPGSIGRDAMRTKERQDSLIAVLKAWQRIETLGMAQTAAIVEKTRNPVIQRIMEIIRQDSAVHHQVQQFIIDTLEDRDVTLTVEDLEQVWAAVEAHIASERRVGQLVADARRALAGTRNVVPQFLLSYLARDEEKHDALLGELAQIRRGLYKSA